MSLGAVNDMPDEFELIRRLAATQRGVREDVVLGIGDDGAVLLPVRGAQLVAVCDTLVAGRHFPEDTDAFAVGWKALAVNLSDLAAMGAVPQWALLALTLPERDVAWVERFGTGFAALAKMSEVALVGGDTTRGPLAITVTALGAVAPDMALRRDGAQVGDRVCIAGMPGEAALGLVAVQAGRRDEPAFAHCIARLDRPEPQLALGQALVGVASACIDVSDGLVADLGHVAAASGVGLRLELDAIPHPPFELGAALGLKARAVTDLALGGGDDYLLAFTVDAARLAELRERVAALGLPLHEIGGVVPGAGVSVITREGGDYAPARAGFNHFGNDDGE
ncbi:MAG TPA: thiamine-phosphate kinase [Pseudomonadota bacterium]|nr:thiamine-phosphate kinase [Pseudomonadota bacterium]